MANPIAVPGTNVPSGAAVSPGGAQGPTTVSANANNKATLGTDSLLLVQGTAAGVAATTHAQTVSGDDPQLTNARTPTAHQASHVTGSDQIPLASASIKGLLIQTSGNTTDFIDGTNNSQPLQPVIWSVRLRSFNAVGNPTFEVDQRNAGGGVTNPANGQFAQDRWQINHAGTMAFNVSNISAGTAVPGTNFFISQNFLRITLTTQQASLGVNDQVHIYQNIEGPRWRELVADVHSISLLVRSSVAGLKFGIALLDNPATKSLLKLCSIPSANVWTLIPLANLPVMPAGNFSILPGQVSQYFKIALAAGSSLTAPANDAFQNGNFQGALGQDNFFSKPVSSTFDIAYAQHEPGAQCSTLIDKPFDQNYHECLRYYTKSFDYNTPITTANAAGEVSYAGQNLPQVMGNVRYKRPLAKGVAPIIYSMAPNANAVFDHFAGTDRTVNGVAWGTDGFAYLSLATATTGQLIRFHYTADTGW